MRIRKRTRLAAQQQTQGVLFCLLDVEDLTSGSHASFSFPSKVAENHSFVSEACRLPLRPKASPDLSAAQSFSSRRSPQHVCMHALFFLLTAHEPTSDAQRTQPDARKLDWASRQVGSQNHLLMLGCCEQLHRVRCRSLESLAIH